MSLDDFFFYLPGYASIPILLVSALVFWLVYRLLTARRGKKEKMQPVENFRKM